MMKVHSLSKSPTECLANEYAWASVKGPGHILHQLPNQDACHVFEFAEGTVLAISDGVGSKKHADIGSKAVVKAVFDATKKWSAYPEASGEQLIRLIHQYWDLYILPYDRDDCAATCLFTVMLQSGRCVMGQIGDGIIMFKLGSDYYILQEKEDLYMNTTMPISNVRSIKEWAMQDFTLTEDFIVFLGTDGVSEDLYEEKRFAFMDHLLNKISASKRQRNKNNKLKQILKTWENPHNLDDKSLIIYKRKVLTTDD